MEILDQDGDKALQYGPTEGLEEFRKLLAQRLKNDGINVDDENIMITVGSQQALDIIGKVGPGNNFLMEDHTYHYYKTSF